MRRIVLCIFLLWFGAGSFAQVPLSPKLRLERLEKEPSARKKGAAAVLQAAFQAVEQGRYKLVGIEDLWATALQEGRTLFSSPNLWGATLPAQTGDMLGQTTIGPWQITIGNAREYGAAYGIEKDWSDSQILVFLESQPGLQARIAADFIEESYQTYGRRGPLAIQRYFWLDAFLQKKIGQGPWYASVLANSPDGMKQTGFYAKQVLLGSRFNPEGLLYWLYRTGDETAVRETLAEWARGGYPISNEDLNHCSCDTEFREWLASLLVQSAIRNPQ